MKNRKRLPLATIPDRCNEKWEEMQGSETERHCGVCDGTVYNLSEMTENEAETLLEADEDRCVVLYRRKNDGVILTADNAPTRPLSQPSRIAVASVAVAFGAAVAATAVVSVAEAPAAHQNEEIEVACGGLKIRTLKPKLKKSERTRRHERRKALRERRFGTTSDERQSKVTRKKRRVRKKLTPRELLRLSTKTERRSAKPAKPASKVPKTSGKP